MGLPVLRRVDGGVRVCVGDEIRVGVSATTIGGGLLGLISVVVKKSSRLGDGKPR